MRLAVRGQGLGGEVSLAAGGCRAQRGDGGSAAQRCCTALRVAPSIRQRCGQPEHRCLAVVLATRHRFDRRRLRRCAPGLAVTNLVGDPAGVLAAEPGPVPGAAAAAGPSRHGTGGQSYATSVASGRGKEQCRSAVATSAAAATRMAARRRGCGFRSGRSAAESGGRPCVVFVRPAPAGQRQRR